MKFNRILAAVMATALTSCLFSNGATTTKVLADEAADDFDPYVFYHEILNEKRPNGAKYYRFLDLDDDNFEELLIYEYKNGGILELYTCNNNRTEPINLFSQIADGAFNYSIFKDGMVSYDVNPSQHAEILGFIRYQISKGSLQPLFGYMLTRKGCFESDNPNLLLEDINIDSEFTNWNSISREIFMNNYYLERKKSYDYEYDERMIPWTMSFYNYDLQKEFDNTNTEKPIAISGRYGYDELIQRYKDILLSPSNVLALDAAQGTICLNNDRYSYFWKEYSYTESGFVLTDLNDDGIKELATGCVEKDGTFKLFDLYTIYENRIIHLAASGLRDVFSISEDKEILESGSSGAADGISMAYQLNEGKLEPVRVMSVESGKFYFYDNFGTASECKTELTNEEWLEKSQTLFKSNRSHEVILFKDWYPEMLIGETASGDVNDDGRFDVSDVILFHKWILNVQDTDISDQMTVDFNNDGQLNIVDLCLMKNELLNRE